MLDWKNREAKAEPRERVDGRGAAARSYLGGLWSRALGTDRVVPAGVYRPGLVLEPGACSVPGAAKRPGRSRTYWPADGGGLYHRRNPQDRGRHLAEQAGRLHFQRPLPARLWMDNMPSWEYGVLVQVRDLSRACVKTSPVRSRSPPKTPTWPRPSRASTSTTRAGSCHRASRSSKRASSR